MDEQASNGPRHPRTRRGSGGSGGPKLADVPTLAETGIANAESGSWIALLAPAELHKTIDSDRERDARVIQARKVKLD